MKKLLFIPVLIFLLSPLFSDAQELVSSSSLTGTRLPTNTFRETNLNTLSYTIGRMDSLTSAFGIKIDRQYSELLYNNADSIFSVFKKYGFTVKNVYNPNLFEVSKSTIRFMVYKNTNLKFSPNNICISRKKY